MDTQAQEASLPVAKPGNGKHASSNGDRPAKRRKPLPKIPKQQRVGNFRSYYTYRLGQKHQGELESDPRLGVLEKDWFYGKRALDIGCNSGEFTITIAKQLQPAYLLGIDVDPQLVSRARAHLKELMQQQTIESAYAAIQSNPKAENGEAEAAKASDEEPKKKQNGEETTKKTDQDAFANELPLSFRLWKPPTDTPASHAVGKASTGTEFPYNVVFKREDFFVDTHAATTQYDVITCLSVTKWIHLLHGDEGIKECFRRMFTLLRPGGRLILEPQPWKSYHKRKFTSEVTAANYQKIQLRPKDFPKFLVETVGFEKCDFLQVCQTSAKGFRRPIYVVQKKKESGDVLDTESAKQ